MKDNHKQPEFNFEAGRIKRDEAMDRVDANANPDWKDSARHIVYRLARKRERFTTDDVWRGLVDDGVEFPHEPRAMGPIMMRAAREGVIRKILDNMRKSNMSDCHQRPKQLWIGI